MSKFIATLIAGLISVSAFAATTTATPTAVSPTATKAVAEPAKEVKKTTAKLPKNQLRKLQLQLQRHLHLLNK